MSSRYYMSGIYEDIFITLRQWRILNVTKLHQKMAPAIHYKALARRVQKLEKQGLIQSYSMPFANRKYVYPTFKAITDIWNNQMQEVNRDEVEHDMATVHVVDHLMGQEIFKEFSLFEDTGLTHLEPDALIQGIFQGTLFKLALEVELNQKNKERIAKKFDAYLLDPSIDAVLYIFSSIAIFRNYRNFMTDLQVERGLKYRPSDKIILLCLPELLKGNFNIFKAECFFKNQRTNLKEIFFGETSPEISSVNEGRKE